MDDPSITAGPGGFNATLSERQKEKGQPRGRSLKKLNAAAAARNGPNGIASERLALPERSSARPYTDPSREPSISASNAPVIPVQAPMPASSFTSPPPKASFLKIASPPAATAQPRPKPNRAP